MKFGGSSVADPDKIKHVAQRARRCARARRSCRRHRLRDGRHDGRPPRARGAGLVAAAPARARHASLHGRADRLCARRDGGPRPRLRGRLVHRLAGRDHHRPRPHEGEDPGDHAGARARGARPGANRPRRRLPGLLTRHDGRDDARTRWNRCHRCGARRGARRVVRDLLGRRGRLHGGSAHRSRRSQARPRLVRGDARDGRLGGEGPDAARRRDRAQSERAHPRALDVLERARDLGAGGRRARAGRSSPR